MAASDLKRARLQLWVICTSDAHANGVRPRLRGTFALLLKSRDRKCAANVYFTVRVREGKRALLRQAPYPFLHLKKQEWSFDGELVLITQIWSPGADV